MNSSTLPLLQLYYYSDVLDWPNLVLDKYGNLVEVWTSGIRWIAAYGNEIVGGPFCWMLEDMGSKLVRLTIARGEQVWPEVGNLLDNL